MGMQVLSYSSGSILTSQELSQEKRTPPLLGENKAVAEKAENTLPDYLDKSRNPGQNLSKVTTELERISMAFDRRLKFVIDPDSREILIKVIDNETDKVIKVLPPEELQRMHGKIRETLGFMFDRMV